MNFRPAALALITALAVGASAAALQKALADLRKQAGLEDALDSLGGNPLPDAFIVTLDDATTNETLFSFNLNSATAPGVFTQSSSGWYYTNWQTVSVDVSLRSGHDFVLSLLANDCPYGGHAGYAYLDGFGATEGGGGTGASSVAPCALASPSTASMMSATVMASPRWPSA